MEPDALLPTMGGQTALNTALALADRGTLEKYDVELIGAQRSAIEMAEDRALFREAMDRIGLENPRATIVSAPKLPGGKYDIAAGVAQAALRATRVFEGDLAAVVAGYVLPSTGIEIDGGDQRSIHVGDHGFGQQRSPSRVGTDLWCAA